MSDKIEDLIATSKGDRAALAKLLTLLQGPSGFRGLGCSDLLEPSSRAVRIGITGAPGVGKSTLIGALLRELRARGMTGLGVLAVDPSSPISQGAVLGDRIRFSDLATDPNIFIRSIGSRGALGGISAASYLLARAFDSAGFRLLFIETVGIGQSEYEIVHLADQVGIALHPQGGDSVQMLKAGILEVGNFFIMNKLDCGNADPLVSELESLRPGIPIFKSVASKSEGIKSLVDWLEHLVAKGVDGGERNKKSRLQAEAKALIDLGMEFRFKDRIDQIETVSDLYQTLFDVLNTQN